MSEEEINLNYKGWYVFELSPLDWIVTIVWSFAILTVNNRLGKAISRNSFELPTEV